MANDAARTEFETLVEDVLQEFLQDIGPEMMARLENVALFVEPEAWYQTRALAFFEGPDRPHMPSAITFLEGPIRRYVGGVDLKPTIRKLLEHEVGHYFGLTHDDMGTEISR